jgi:hypothetical protein
MVQALPSFRPPKLAKILRKCSGWDPDPLNVTPHVAQNDTHRRSAIDQRTTRHPGYQISQQKRKRVEEIFGWLKTVGGLRKLRHRGLERVDWMFTFAVAAYNPVRIRNLEIAT